MKNHSKYLPSKKFIIIISICAIFIVGTFLIFFSYSKKEDFKAQEARRILALKVGNQTISELMQNDSDGDSVSDWEESLWGTDKNKRMTFEGTPDSAYIENKKKELKVEDGVNEKKLTETEKFAREFLASFTAMKDSGQVDQDTINGFSNALGQKIVNPDLIDQFNASDAKIGEDNASAKKVQYYLDMRERFQSFQEAGIGDELDIVNSGLASYGTSNDPDQYSQLPIIADAYKNFAKKIIGMSVPGDLLALHLQIANSSNNTGISVQNMSEIINDPLVGLEGLTQYQKYSEDLVKAVEELETTLAQE